MKLRQKKCLCEPRVIPFNIRDKPKVLSICQHFRFIQLQCKWHAQIYRKFFGTSRCPLGVLHPLRTNWLEPKLPFNLQKISRTKRLTVLREFFPAFRRWLQGSRRPYCSKIVLFCLFKLHLLVWESMDEWRGKFSSSVHRFPIFYLSGVL